VPVALGVFAGLPAAGKSRLCRLICARKSNSFATVHVCYDQLMEDHIQVSNQGTWKNERLSIVKSVESLIDCVRRNQLAALLSSHGDAALAPLLSIFGDVRDLSSLWTNHSPLVILIDDNNFYRSMRFEYAQLARKYRCGFCEIFVECPPEVAIGRNARRSNENRHKVSEQTIVKMHANLELPNAERFDWEKLSLHLNGTEEEENEKLAAGVEKIVELIHLALETPLTPVVSEEQLAQTAKSRKINLDNKIHQFDIQWRRAAAGHLRNIAASQRASVAARLATEKVRLLWQLRHHGGCVEEDIETRVQQTVCGQHQPPEQLQPH